MNAVRAEWTKLRTHPGTGWLLCGIVALTVGLSGAADATAGCPVPGCQPDPARIGLTGVQVGQIVVVVLAVLAIGGEYGTGMITTSLAAVPRRTVLLLAKAITLATLVAVAGAVAVAGCVPLGHLLLPRHGLGPAQGYPPFSPGDPAMLRAFAGSVLYLVLVALLSLGTAAAVRDPTAAIGIVLGLLYVFPLLAQAVTQPHWKRHLQQIQPMPAGLDIQSTVTAHAQALTPWAGIGVLAAWAGGALLVGWLVLVRRDA